MRRSPWALQRIEQPPAARERAPPAPEQQATEMTQDLAVMQERLAAAPMTATPATASPAWRLQHVSFEKLTCSYFGPVADQIVIVGQLQVLRDAEIEATTRAGLGHASRGDLRQSMSGDGWRARLKSDASGVQMDELGVGGQIQQCNSLTCQQIRRCRDHHRVGQCHDGADRAVIGWLAVGSLIGGGP